MSVRGRARKVLEEAGLIDPETGKPIFRVSMLLTCPYRYFFDKKKGLTVENGELMHRRVQRVFAEKGWVPEYEVRYELPKYVIVGHIDLYEPSSKRILEIKFGDKIYATYRMQVLSYAALIYASTGEMPSSAEIAQIPGNTVIEEYDSYEKVVGKLVFHRVFPPLVGAEKVLSSALQYLMQSASEIYNAFAKGWVKKKYNEFCPYCPFRRKCSAYASAVRDMKIKIL